MHLADPRFTDPAAPVLRDALGTLHQPAGSSVRIVSLVPSLTELLFELDLGAQVVGRTGFCIHPREALRAVPKVGGTKDVKMDRIRELAPTHVIANIDENRRETIDELAAFVPNIVVTHPCGPRDNLALFDLFGGLFGRERAAQALAADLRAALGEAEAVRAALPAERVLYLIWREPWMTVARDTYVSAMLAEVGWTTLPGVHGGVSGAGRYPAFDWSAGWLGDVERVFLSSEPYHFQLRHADEVTALSGRPATLIDGEMVSWYGSRVVAGLRYLAGLRRQLVDFAR